MKLFVTTLLLTFLSISTFAKTTNTARVPAQTDADINQESIDSFKKVDIQLNSLWKKIQAHPKMTKDLKASFLVAQRAWINYKEKECKLSADIMGNGTIYISSLYGCYEEMTTQRIKELEQYQPFFE